MGIPDYITPLYLHDNRNPSSGLFADMVTDDPASYG